MKKTDLGQFNTKRDVWLKPQVAEFIKSSINTKGLDPFAGGGDLVKAMFDLGMNKVRGLDVDPSLNWQVNDSLVDIPYFGDTIVITNPPYYARVSASRKKSSCLKYFKNNNFADLYQIAIARVLEKYDDAVFIIPETYFLTEDVFFKDNLLILTVLEDNPFYDTDCPVCVACFSKSDMFEYKEYDIYKNDELLFNNNELDAILRRYTPNTELLNITFNDPKGNIGLRGIDGTKADEKIKFCLPEDLNYDIKKIKVSSRAITILNVEGDFDRNELIEQANFYLNRFREETSDVILAPFKGNNKEGKRRRRLDFAWARKLLNRALTNSN